MEKRKIIGILLGIGIVIVAIIIAIAGYKILKKTDESETSQVEEKSKSKELNGISSKVEIKNSVLNAINKDNNILNTVVENKAKQYMEDYEIIGTIEIPRTGLKCNILDETTKRSLEIAVSKIYTTGGLNKPGNTVIYGHNYRNSLFFSKNKILQNGDEVYITDVDRNRMVYEIYNIFETTSSDTTFYTRMPEDTEGKCEITLSTCTDDASQTDRRLIVQAREI